jgi:flagellar hook-associated protein 2
MTVEAAPQDRLKTKVSTAQTAVTSYQSVNSKISTFKSAGDALSQLSSWRCDQGDLQLVRGHRDHVDQHQRRHRQPHLQRDLAGAKQSPRCRWTPRLRQGRDGKDDDSAAIPDIDHGHHRLVRRDGSFTGRRPTVPSTSAPTSRRPASPRRSTRPTRRHRVRDEDRRHQGVLQMTSAKTGAANGFQIDGLDGRAGRRLAGHHVRATTRSSGQRRRLQHVHRQSSTNTFTNLMAGVT